MSALQGNNKNGRLGNGKTSLPKVYAYSPQLVEGGSNWVSVSARGSHSCGIKNDNTAWCWGGNTNGEIGTGQVGGMEVSPYKIPGNWKNITAGLRFSCAINMQDQLYCWGTLSGGGGDVEATFGGTPQLIGNSSMTWKSVAGGMQHVCGLLTDGTARCFGLGWHGQLGNGLNTTFAVPYATSCSAHDPCEPVGGYTYTSIACGEYDTCATRTDGILMCEWLAVLLLKFAHTSLTGQ